MLSRQQIQIWLPFAVLTVLVLAVGGYDRTFFSVSNFLSVTSDTMTLFLMASGVTLVIMMGGIDLSVQAVASMTSCILAIGEHDDDEHADHRIEDGPNSAR